MAQQAGEFDQLARIVAQIAKRKGMAQRMRRHRYPLQAGSTGKVGDDGLDSAHWHRRIAAADKQRRIFAGGLATFEMLLECAPGRCVQWPELTKRPSDTHR